MALNTATSQRLIANLLDQIDDLKAAPAKPSYIQLKVGDKVPALDLHLGFPPQMVNMGERLAGKKTIILGLPGAFTPCWSTKQVPGYLAKQSALKAKGIDEVIVYCVNDGAVMTAWAKDQGIDGSMITFMGDPTCEFSKALGAVIDHPGPNGCLGPNRCKRFAVFADNGVIKAFHVSEGPDDPAGDNHPDTITEKGSLLYISSVEGMLDVI